MGQSFLIENNLGSIYEGEIEASSNSMTDFSGSLKHATQKISILF